MNGNETSWRCFPKELFIFWKSPLLLKKKRKRKGRLFSFYREEVDLYHLKSKKGAVQWHTKQKAKSCWSRWKSRIKHPNPFLTLHCSILIHKWFTQQVYYSLVINPFFVPPKNSIISSISSPGGTCCLIW